MTRLTEDELRAISKQYAVIIPHSPQNVSANQVTKLTALLQDLIDTALVGSLPPKYRAAACNALCGAVDSFLDSEIDQIRKIALDEEIEDNLLHFYLDRFQDATPRSMKQWQSTLVKLLQEHADSVLPLRDWISVVTTRCLKSVSSTSDLASLKPSIMLLDNLLSKDIIGIEKFAEALSSHDLIDNDCIETKTVKCTRPDDLMSRFVMDILRWSQQADITSIAGRFLRTLSKKTKKQETSFEKFTTSEETSSEITTSPKEDQTIWIEPLLDMARKNFVQIERLEKHILPELLLDEQGTLMLVRKLPMKQLLSGSSGGLEEAEIRLSLLLAKILGELKLSANLRSSLFSELQIEIPHLQKMLAIYCLDLRPAEIRLAAADIIITGETITQPFSESDLKYLKPVIKSLFVETDAKIRGNAYKTIKQLTERLQLILNKLKRQECSLNIEPLQSNVASGFVQHDVTISYHQSFVAWFHDFLTEELRPSASFQRHVMSLETLNMDQTFNLFIQWLDDPFPSDVISQLLDLVLDAYDDVRRLAASLLAHLHDHADLNLDINRKESHIGHASDRMMTTGRASISDGYARLVNLAFGWKIKDGADTQELWAMTQQFVASIKEALSVANKDLRYAVARPKLHGQFIAIRYVLSNYKSANLFGKDKHLHDLIRQVFECCILAWGIVKPVLCIDSPEGHGDEEDTTDLDIGVKDTLSFSWRTLKETSALLQSILDNWDISLDECRAIGRLCFTQLSDLRHRGAFSTVAQCFTSCCIQVAGKNEAGRVLLEQWCQDLFHLLDTQSAVLTRRSAGLPAMMTAILASGPGNDLFNAAIERLQGIAQAPASLDHKHAETSLPQVHAMNLLKDIFANSKLGPAAETYLESSMKIAVQSMNHSIWSIRNCGGMLMKAILNRLTSGYGVTSQSNHEGHRNFSRRLYEKYSSLSSTVLALLDVSSPDNSDTEKQINNGFPVLEILDLIGIDARTEIRVRRGVLSLLDSPIWSLRERAAQVAAELVNNDHLLSVLSWQIQDKLEKSKTAHTNSVHGYLMCIRACVNGSTDDTTMLLVMRRLFEQYDTLIEIDNEFVLTEYLETATDLLDVMLRTRHCTVYSEISCLAMEIWKQRCPHYKHFCSRDERGSRTLSEAGARFSLHLQTLLLYCGKVSPEDLSNDEIATRNIHLVLEITAKHPWPTNDWREYIVGRLASCAAWNSSGMMGDQQIKLLKAVTTASFAEHIEVDGPRGQLAALLEACRILRDSDGEVLRLSLELEGTLMCRAEPDTCWNKYWQGWLSTIGSEISDEMDSSNRYSLLRSLGHISGRLNSQVRSRGHHISDGENFDLALPAMTILYDGLLDDDADVRNLAALIGSRFFAGGVSDKSPMLTSQAVIELMFEYFRSYKQLSDALPLEAMSRVLVLTQDYVPLRTTSKAKHAVLTQWLAMDHNVGPVAKHVQEVVYEDNALFSEERQNLYKDVVSEMEHWSGILLELEPQSSKSWQKIYEWAIHGLKAIHLLADTATPGWASRQEGFEVVCQVLLLAKVVQTWSSDEEYLRRLWKALVDAKSQLSLVHRTHSRLIRELTVQFEAMNLYE